jgi:hypothetical protein
VERLPALYWPPCEPDKLWRNEFYFLLGNGNHAFTKQVGDYVYHFVQKTSPEVLWPSSAILNVYDGRQCDQPPGTSARGRVARLKTRCFRTGFAVGDVIYVHADIRSGSFLFVFDARSGRHVAKIKLPQYFRPSEYFRPSNCQAVLGEFLFLYLQSTRYLPPNQGSLLVVISMVSHQFAAQLRLAPGADRFQINGNRVLVPSRFRYPEGVPIGENVAVYDITGYNMPKL